MSLKILKFIGWVISLLRYICRVRTTSPTLMCDSHVQGNRPHHSPGCEGSNLYVFCRFYFGKLKGRKEQGRSVLHTSPCVINSLHIASFVTCIYLSEYTLDIPWHISDNVYRSDELNSGTHALPRLVLTLVVWTVTHLRRTKLVLHKT